MKNLSAIFILVTLIVSCTSGQKKRDTQTFDEGGLSDPVTKQSQEYVHLHDTIKISGKTILILRPDSLRFQSYLDSGKEWIYEVDSDFGFGFSKALDSLNMDGVTETVSVKRYVKIENCRTCPLTIDRDSIDYGYILTKPNGEIEIDENVFEAEYYIKKFENYFKEK